MAMRKEQVLVLASLLVGGLVYWKGRSAPMLAPRVSPGKAEYKVEPVPKAPHSAQATASGHATARAQTDSTMSSGTYTGPTSARS